MQCNVEVIFSGCASSLCGWTFLASSSSVIYLKVPFDSKMCFQTAQSDFSQSANSSGTRDCFLRLWAVTGSSRIKDPFDVKEFLLQTLRRPCLFSSKQNTLYEKAKTQRAFRKRTVFREFHRFYFSLFLLCSSVRVRDEKHRCDNRCSMGPLKRSKANLRTVMITGFPPLA